MEDTDLELLELLRADGRLPVSSLAERAHVSRPHVYSRLRALERAGILGGFSARVDSAKLGLGISAAVQIAVQQPARGDLVPLLEDMAEVEYAAFVTGETDVLAIVRASSVDHLRERIIWPLEEHHSVRATRTALILNEIVKRPYVLPRRSD